MQCFYHPDNFAIGICKSCSKGLCRECITDVGNGIACKNKCEEQVQTLNMALAKGKKTYDTTSKSYLRNTYFFAMSGIVFLIFGLARHFDSFPIAMGAIFVAMAFWSYASSKAYKKQ